MTSTYAAPAAPPPQPSPIAQDPTNVMGRRFLAWFIDLAIFLAIFGGLAMALWEHSDVPDGSDGDEHCDAIEALPEFDGRCVGVEEITVVVLIEDDKEFIPSAAALGWGVINFVILQGLTGGSLGKLISGVRVVNAQGERAGIGRSTGRTAFWIVDGAPWIFPLVGLITALTSSGHRRVGDMVMSTYVVGRKHVGTPINVSPVAPPPGQTSWGSAPSTAPPPEAQWPATEPQPWAPPPQPWDAPESSSPAQPTPAPSQASEPQPESQADPWATPQREAQPEPGAQSGEAAQPGVAEPTPREQPTSEAAPSEPSFAERYSPEPPPEETEPSWGQALADESEATESSSSDEPAVDDQESADAEHSQGYGDWAAAPSWVSPAETAETAEPEEPARTEITPAPGSEPLSADPTTVYPSQEPQPAGDVAPSDAPTQGEAEAQPGPETGQPMPPPEWDAARNTYIQWDPNRQAWLQWDNNSSQWRPIDT